MQQVLEARQWSALIEEGQIDAVIDLTTTEIADELFDGVLDRWS